MVNRPCHSVLLFLAVLGLLPGQGWAQSRSSAPKGRKRAEINVVERKRKASSSRKKAPNPTRSRAFYATVEKKLIKNIDRTISFLKRTEKTLAPKSAAKLQVKERILNLHLEQAIYVRSEEERRFDQRWNRWQASGRKGVEPKLNTAKSNGHWRSVISNATTILREFPGNKSADLISYNKAIAYQYLGSEVQSAKMFKDIITKYPNSNVVGNAYISLGDYYFDKNDFRSAYKNYNSALRFKRSKQYLWSLFKLAWCSYNLGQYTKSVNFWKQVVSESRKRKSSPGSLQLKEEALRDMAYGFAELGNIDNAISYYKRNGGTKYIGSFLLLLSQILSDQGKYRRAIAVLKRYQTQAPFDEGAPGAAKEIASLYFALGKVSKVWSELKFQLRNYSPKSAWARRNSKEVVAKTWVDIKDQVLYYGSVVHQRAIKGDSIPLNKQAIIGYKLFLKSFPNAKEGPTVRYFLADIAYYLGDYQAAGGFYQQIAMMGKAKAVKVNFRSGKRTNMHKDVSIEMVGSYAKDFEPEFKLLKKRTPNFKKPRKVSARAKRYIKACQLYSKWYPSDRKRVKTCELGVSNIYYQSGIRDKAKSNLMVLAKKYPGTKEGNRSAELLLSLAAENPSEFKSISKFLLAIPTYKRGPIGRKIAAFEREKEKASIAKVNAPLKRAQLYEAQARKFPKDPEVDKLWYNAAVNYINGGDIDKAVGAYTVLWTKFPKKKQSEEALLQLAKIYQSKLNWPVAQRYLSAYAQRYPKAKLAEASLNKSCELSVALDRPNALAICEQLAKRDPGSAAFYVGQIIRSKYLAKDSAAVRSLVMNSYLPKYKLSANQQILALQKIRDLYGPTSAVGRKATSQMVATYRRNSAAVSGEALRSISKMYFGGAQAKLPGYLKMKLRGGTVENLIASLQKKAGALAAVEKGFAEVVNTKDPYFGAASFYLLGNANEDLAQQLENPPAIKGAKKADVVKQLGPQIAQIKQQRDKWYKKGLDTVTKFKVYSTYSRKLAATSAAKGGVFPMTDDFIPIADNLSTSVTRGTAASLR